MYFIRRLLPILLCLYALPATAGNVFLVQLGSHKTAGEAESAWEKLQQNYPHILSNLSHQNSEIILPPAETKIYRLQAGPFDNRNHALEVCGILQEDGQDCFVVETAMFTPNTTAGDVLANTGSVPTTAAATQDNTQNIVSDNINNSASPTTDNTYNNVLTTYDVDNNNSQNTSNKPTSKNVTAYEQTGNSTLHGNKEIKNNNEIPLPWLQTNNGPSHAQQNAISNSYTILPWLDSDNSGNNSRQIAGNNRSENVVNNANNANNNNDTTANNNSTLGYNTTENNAGHTSNSGNATGNTVADINRANSPVDSATITDNQPTEIDNNIKDTNKVATHTDSANIDVGNNLLPAPALARPPVLPLPTTAGNNIHSLSAYDAELAEQRKRLSRNVQPQTHDFGNGDSSMRNSSSDTHQHADKWVIERKVAAGEQPIKTNIAKTNVVNSAQPLPTRNIGNNTNSKPNFKSPNTTNQIQLQPPPKRHDMLTAANNKKLPSSLANTPFTGGSASAAGSTISTVDVGSHVEVAEAIQVPLAEEEPELSSKKPIFGVFTGPKALGWGATPSQNFIQKTLWAQLSHFSSKKAAMSYWRQLQHKFPTATKNMRVRITQPYQRRLVTNKVSLQIGPVLTMTDLRKICELATNQNLVCLPRRDFGNSTTAKVARYRPVERAYDARRAALTSKPNMRTGYWVQLGSYRDSNTAFATWRSLRARHSELAKLQPHIARPKLSSSPTEIYRLRTGPYNTRYAAQYLCDSLKQQNTRCLVVAD